MRSKFHKTDIYSDGKVVITIIPKETFHKAMMHKPLRKVVDSCRFWFVRDPEWPPGKYRCFKGPGTLSLVEETMSDLGLTIDEKLYVNMSDGDISALVLSI